MPWVLYGTTSFMGWYIPSMGTVFAGLGTVWENLTCSIPMFNPIHLLQYHCSLSLYKLPVDWYGQGRYGGGDAENYGTL